MTKFDGYLLHSLQRAADRYGLDIYPHEYVALSRKIAFHEASGSEDCVRLAAAKGGREKWATWFKGEWIPVIFDPSQGRIVTLLPKHELRPFAKRLPW